MKKMIALGNLCLALTFAPHAFGIGPTGLKVQCRADSQPNVGLSMELRDNTITAGPVNLVGIFTGSQDMFCEQGSRLRSEIRCIGYWSTSQDEIPAIVEVTIFEHRGIYSGGFITMRGTGASGKLVCTSRPIPPVEMF